MRKILLSIIAILSLTNCKTAPVETSQAAVYNPTFEKFEIRKILSQGIQKIEVFPGAGEWPDVQYKELSVQKFKSQKLRFAVVGDTGCRLSEAKNKVDYQNCADSGEWPYPQVIQSVVKEKYDFAIHTGDYHYREHCTDPLKCPQYSKSVGYNWGAWWDDFYGPSQELFKKTPVLFVRGNHEDCDRAHIGWGPLSSLQKTFTLKCEDECTETEPYQWIEIGDLVLINFDDSAFLDRKPSPEEVRKKWLGLLVGLRDRIAALPKKKEIWFLAHKPVMGFVPDRKNNSEPKLIDQYLRQVMQESKLNKKIDYFLSGHIHNQQIVHYEKDLFQLIVGHSGSSLDPFGRKLHDEKVVSTTDSDRSFGYALFERAGFKKWNLIYKDVAGKTVLSCRLTNKKIRCK